MRKDIAKFYAKDIFLSYLKEPEYYFNNINTEFLLAAIQKAKLTALEIESNLDIVLGKIKIINQEQFAFCSLGKNVKSYSNFLKKKILRIVTTVSYYLI
ncbi:hypothetical protein [Borrelia sp. HM]|uniref:hypothetical protein n=1 Tax=Borrelia sp. HM TaxID=1882662 RepID=UPI001C77AFCF|nr:hypothetical protein [Borrelia sp. HM]BCR21658.1 hypothetical protein BKFM_00223 [Borrelia sp. HM]